VGLFDLLLCSFSAFPWFNQMSCCIFSPYELVIHFFFYIKYTVYLYCILMPSFLLGQFFLEITAWIHLFILLLALLVSCVLIPCFKHHNTLYNYLMWSILIYLYFLIFFFLACLRPLLSVSGPGERMLACYVQEDFFFF